MKVILSITTHEPSANGYAVPLYSARVLSNKVDPTTRRRPVLLFPGRLGGGYFNSAELEREARAHLALFGFTDVQVNRRSGDDED
jgi:hypothetical protein